MIFNHFPLRSGLQAGKNKGYSQAFRGSWVSYVEEKMPKTLNNSTPSPVSPINRGNTQISCNPVHLFKLKVSLFKLFRQADLSKLLHQYLRCADGFTHARKYLTSFIFLKFFYSPQMETSRWR